MHISQIIIENFRAFGAGDDKLVLPLQSGLTALVGENDSGKTAIIDALRFVLGTRDQYYIPIDDSDFHTSKIEVGGDGEPTFEYKTSEEISIQCKFSNLSTEKLAAFAEYLTYEDDETVLYVNWIAKRAEGQGTNRVRRWAEVCSGSNADGPSLDSRTRELLSATYLRPLRDAEREMSAGRNSRLSQVLQVLSDVKERKDNEGKTILDIGDEAANTIEKHPAISGSADALDTFLKPLSFSDDTLTSNISISSSKEDNIRLKQLLEKLELELLDKHEGLSGNRGLGSNNLLFMACEILLLGEEAEGFPIILIEEPEAHLHPQRQLRVMQFLQSQAKENDVQVIVTTHSPQLASVLKLENMAIIKNGKSYPLSSNYTKLKTTDYRFLERFLDATKANLFFAKGIMIVEGDAENILLPTLARLIGKDLAEHGVSIVNVGHIGLSRYAKIFQSEPEGNEIDIAVACVADADVLPECAPEILGLDRDAARRRWKVESDFQAGGLEAKREEIRVRASGGNVKSFVSDIWTFEYELAKSGLLEEVWLAARLAKDDSNSISSYKTLRRAKNEVKKIIESELSLDQKATHCYSLFNSKSTAYAPGESKASKAISAQYLASLLIKRFEGKEQELREQLPLYIVKAIDHVTSGNEAQ